MCRTDRIVPCGSAAVNGCEVARTTVAGRPYAKTHPCAGCGFAFRPHAVGGWRRTPVVVVTERVNRFRGDDEVTFYHPGCFKPEGYTP